MAKGISKRLEQASPFRLFVYDVIESKTFGAGILFVILLNTVMLVVQTSEEISVLGGWYFSAIDNVFLAIYIVELVLKLYALGWSFFKIGWNIMDFIIVICTTADFLLPLIVENVGSFDVAAIFRLLRMFRAIKALRALRVLRTIRFLKNLQVIMTTILKSFRALSTIVLLQTLFLYMFAVIGRGLFYKVDPDRFGSMGRAFFTLFQLITLDDWFYMYKDVVDANSDYSFILIYLITYIVLENFIFMNLFVAVLVDNFQRTLSAAESKRKSKEIKTNMFAVNLASDDLSSTDSDYSDNEEQMQGKKPNEEVPVTKLKTINDFYDKEEYTKRDRELIHQYFSLTASLEYNVHQLHAQHKIIDELVDIVVTIPDVPEELI